MKKGRISLISIEHRFGNCIKVRNLWCTNQVELTLSSLWSSFCKPSRLLACRASRRSFSKNLILSAFCTSSEALRKSQNHHQTNKVFADTSRMTLAISAKRKGNLLNSGRLVSLASRSCRKSRKWYSIESVLLERLYKPTLSHSGGTMWHFFFSFRLVAIQRGMRHFAGGRSGPYAPYMRRPVGGTALEVHLNIVPKWKLSFPLW